MTVWTEAVGFFRTHLETTFEDACTIVSTTSRGTFNPVTNRYTTPSETTAYTGACLIRPAGLGADPRDRADAEVVIGRYDIRIPFDQDTIVPDMIVTVTASTFDSGLVGKTMTVIAVDNDTYNTHRLVSAELNQGHGTP